MGLYTNRVVLDSNVLFSRATRDWFGLLTTSEHIVAPFKVYWTGPYEVYTPAFRVLVDDVAPELVLVAVHRQLSYWKSDRFIEALQRAGCPEFADQTLAHLRRIALGG